MNNSADLYFTNGCGRCPLGGTLQCKVHRWANELKMLRRIILSCGLAEESKWGSPCYVYNGKNVLMLISMKDYCGISFFKGVLIQDQAELLRTPGPNSQSVRLLKFENSDEIERIHDEIKAYIFEAVEIEKAGLTVEFKVKPEPIPQELQDVFNQDPVIKMAFENLTPGRQRGYILYFSQAKQSKTRINRIKKCIPMIVSGIGMHDHYKSKA